MAVKIIMPKQGLQMTEGTISQWLIPEGKKCEEGKPLFEMETDKLTITMDAPASGTLLKIVHGVGDVVPITQIIGVIGEPGEDISDILAEAAKEAGGEDVAVQGQSKSQTQPQSQPGVGYDYDVAVIGGGPGGYVAALRCAQYGLKTILAEKRDLGGTCLNRGCIPTKALLHSAETYEEIIKNGKELGITVGDVTVDFGKTAERKKKIVAQMTGGVKVLLKKRGVNVVADEAKLTGAHSFTSGGKEYTTDNFILAMGSEPAKIPIPGIDQSGVLDSDEVLDLDALPESVVIIGGGVIGIEFATLFSSFGKKVTIVEMLPQILNTIDADAANTMRAILEQKGVEIHTAAKVLEIKSGMSVVYEEEGTKKEAGGEMVIVAIGRRPVTKDCGLEATGVQVTDRGFINVDEHLRTNVPNIYAIGDITGKIQLAHAASAQGLVVAANLHGIDRKMSYNKVPSCIYSNPEIATVGLSESEARGNGLDVKTGFFSTSGNGRSVILGCTDGFAKIVSDAKTGEVYGATILSPRATDMIGEIVVAMNAEATIEEIADAIHPHPTVSEIIMEAAEDTSGLSIHKV